MEGDPGKPAGLVEEGNQDRNSSRNLVAGTAGGLFLVDVEIDRCAPRMIADLVGFLSAGRFAETHIEHSGCAERVDQRRLARADFVKNLLETLHRRLYSRDTNIFRDLLIYQELLDDVAHPVGLILRGQRHLWTAQYG